MKLVYMYIVMTSLSYAMEHVPLEPITHENAHVILPPVLHILKKHNHIATADYEKCMKKIYTLIVRTCQDPEFAQKLFPLVDEYRNLYTSQQEHTRSIEFTHQVHYNTTGLHIGYLLQHQIQLFTARPLSPRHPTSPTTYSEDPTSIQTPIQLDTSLLDNKDISTITFNETIRKQSKNTKIPRRTHSLPTIQEEIDTENYHNPCSSAAHRKNTMPTRSLSGCW